MSVIASIAFVLLALLVQCGSSNPIGATISADQFCARFGSSFCALHDACGCPSSNPCSVAAQTQNCQDTFFSMQVGAAMGAGHLHYDPAAAAALVARLDARPPICADAYVVMGVTLRNGATFAGVFSGTLPSGSACMTSPPDPRVSSAVNPSDCVAPARCNSGVCANPVFFGDPCVASLTCVNPDATPDAFDYEAVGVCIAKGSVTTCAPRQPAGAACTMNSDCVSTHCVAGACTAPLANGAACSDPHECASGVCESTDKRCHSKGTGTPGSPCAISSDCVWGNCGGAPALCGPPPFCLTG